VTDPDPLVRFEAASSRARDEAAPDVDVTDAVLARLRAERRAAPLLDPRDRVTWLLVAASLLVASVAGALGAVEWSALGDPLDQLIGRMATGWAR